MTLYSSPPPLRAFRDDKATLLVSWWCTVFSAVIILFRACGRYIRSEKLFREDRIALATMIPLFIRMGLVHVVLLYGTNNTVTTGLSDEEIRRRVIGSKLVLVSRLFYAGTLWMLKFTITEFFKRLTYNIWRESYERTLVFIRYLLLVSFIAIFIADLSECQPFSHYYQVVPDPGGQCRQAYAQVITMGTVDVLTDLLLVFFPIPIIIRSHMPLKRKIQLVLLFAGSLIPAGVTLYRIPHIIDRHGRQQYRSLLASVEILFATGVANALVLGSFVRDRGVKKQRWKFGSLTDSMERTSSRRGTLGRQWGSDEDLVRGLGLGVDPELRGAIQASTVSSPRPAPMATPAHVPIRSHRSRRSAETGGVSNDWVFPTPRSDYSEEIELVRSPDRSSQSADRRNSMASPFRKVSFFDVGGLLDDEPSNRRVSSTQTFDTDGEDLGPLHATSSFDQSANLYPPPQQRRGSTIFLQDVGGLLGPRTRPPERSATYELQTFLREGPPPATHPHSRGVQPGRLARQPTMNSLKDVGGLLSK
ncbi:hypothetical protein F5884DRAFT_38436 [Xylogone sp. PMI_703]|nr:hypothetical protein F5884DRAFT_38436 [Xylogone sp. PMI_703]